MEQRKLASPKSRKWMVLVMVAFCLPVNTVWAQSMDPRVTITETDPPSDGIRVRGTIARDVLLNCFVENLPATLQVRWQRTYIDQSGREVSLPISTDMDVTDMNKWSIEKPTTFSWRLRVKAIQIADEGNYMCFVRLTSNNNMASSNRTIFATDPPMILDAQSSNNVFAREGDFVPLYCNATGRPIPTLIWRREGNAILPGGGVTHMGSRLNIQEVQYTARGRYYCEAFNEVGYDRREIVLTIQHAPKLFPDPAETSQALGYQRTLVCHIDAYPMPSLDWDRNQLSWIKDSQAIQPDERKEIRAIVGAYNRVTFELVIKNVIAEDMGEYTCQARNNLGTGSTKTRLSESDTPLPDKGGQISSAGVPAFQVLAMVIPLLMTLLAQQHL